jgi:hypothetical protein
MNNMCGKPNMNTNIYDAQNYGYQPANNMSYTPNSSTTNSSGMTGQMMNQWQSNTNNQWHNQETIDKINQIQNSAQNNMINPGNQSISLTPETLSNTDFLPAYLSKHIGKWIRAEFLIGGFLEQRVGILYEVGASYIIIKSIEPDTLVACDLFSIRFVTIVLNNDFPKLMSF